MLVEKGLLATDQIDAIVERYERDLGPQNGARVVARAWVDPDYRERLRSRTAPPRSASSATAGSRAARWSSSRTRRTCTTSSSARSAPATRGPSSGCRRPGTRARRTARASSPSRARCSASSASSSPRRPRSACGTRRARCGISSCRERPAGTEGMSEDELAALVTRDSMIGTGLAERRRVSRSSDPAVVAVDGPAAPPRSNGELVFAEPWESRAFGVAVALARRGCHRLRGVPCSPDRRDRRHGRRRTGPPRRGTATTSDGSRRSSGRCSTPASWNRPCRCRARGASTRVGARSRSLKRRDPRDQAAGRLTSPMYRDSMIVSPPSRWTTRSTSTTSWPAATTN